MVIQSNMQSKAIVEIWKNTAYIFEKYNIPITEKLLVELVETNFISTLLKELNDAIGSSNTTCIEGG
jgi:hypothetical protein